MSYSFRSRKKQEQQAIGKGKRNGYWSLVKGKKGYQVKWYGV